MACGDAGGSLALPPHHTTAGRRLFLPSPQGPIPSGGAPLRRSSRA
eukprot:CAMPEP_0185427630 /NCGR_PEP_ID=MMETSP1365-20130426/15562_1 /TAXON_ID=38817 /ORGANISM="Gephyrocapsa oceanica, Strain RCC1303" /LENGTH=45 /DNA_ID= /DNA_START= /DNA_END= /DNA_ORIENTATION=